jgi:hypothetical protein
VFDPPPEQRLAPGPVWDLEALLAEVLAKGAELLGVSGPLQHHRSVGWSRHVLRGWYGLATWAKADPHGYGSITINVLLDSPDISRDTMLFLFWHEFLHMHQGHTPESRELERTWPGYAKWDRELDNLRERFDLSER